MSVLPQPADALPAAEHHCRRAVAHLEGRPARGSLVEALVALLEAAGGPDVGNAVRVHLERTGAPAPSAWAADRGRDRVLVAALRLHRAAERALRDDLRAAGLALDDPPPLDGGPPSAGRGARGHHAGRVLAERGAAVEHVLAALAGGDLPAGAGDWAAALAGAESPGQPPGRPLCHGETAGQGEGR